MFLFHLAGLHGAMPAAQPDQVQRGPSLDSYESEDTDDEESGSEKSNVTLLPAAPPLPAQTQSVSAAGGDASLSQRPRSSSHRHSRQERRSHGRSRRRAPGVNGAKKRIDPGKEDAGTVATGMGEVMAVGRKAGSAMEEDKMTIASAVLKKRNGAAAAEHHCAETRVVRLQSNCKRGRRPIRALQWESCISSASIAAGGLAVSIRWSNINGAASTALRSKARVRAPRARPDDNALVAAGLRMKLEHGSSTTMLALLVILIQPRKRSKWRLSSNCPNRFPPALPALQVEVRCLRCSFP